MPFPFTTKGIKRLELPQRKNHLKEDTSIKLSRRLLRSSCNTVSRDLTFFDSKEAANARHVHVQALNCLNMYQCISEYICSLLWTFNCCCSSRLLEKTQRSRKNLSLSLRMRDYDKTMTRAFLPFEWNISWTRKKDFLSTSFFVCVCVSSTELVRVNREIWKESTGKGFLLTASLLNFISVGVFPWKEFPRRHSLMVAALFLFNQRFVSFCCHFYYFTSCFSEAFKKTISLDWLFHVHVMFRDGNLLWERRVTCFENVG